MWGSSTWVSRGGVLLLLLLLRVELIEEDEAADGPRRLAEETVRDDRREIKVGGGRVEGRMEITTRYFDEGLTDERDHRVPKQHHARHTARFDVFA